MTKVQAIKIGLDLDNTVIDYSIAFADIGKRIGMFPSNLKLQNKSEVKAYLIEKDPTESEWMRLQGMVYGSQIESARLYPGVMQFLSWTASCGHSVSIVSHKSNYGHFDENRVNLREAATTFLENRGILNVKTDQTRCLKRSDIFFEETRDEKVHRIRKMKFDFFVDDLLEVLDHEGFPQSTQGLWFNSDDTEISRQRFRHWNAIQEFLSKGGKV
jgi:hypothetical protein